LAQQSRTRIDTFGDQRVGAHVTAHHPGLVDTPQRCLAREEHPLAKRGGQLRMLMHLADEPPQTRPRRADQTVGHRPQTSQQVVAEITGDGKRSGVGQDVDHGVHDQLHLGRPASVQDRFPRPRPICHAFVGKPAESTPGQLAEDCIVDCSLENRPPAPTPDRTRLLHQTQLLYQIRLRE